VDVRVELVAPEATYPLRQRVLRPHQRVTEVRVPGEDGRDAAHIAAVDANGDVVGTAVLVREMCPLLPERNLAWRLRGMATDERWRGRGVGGLLLRRVVQHVAAHGGGLLWCHARLPAQAFYGRAGFVPVGEPWEEPQIGPHVAMLREVAPAEPVEAPIDVPGPAE